MSSSRQQVWWVVMAIMLMLPAQTYARTQKPPCEPSLADCPEDGCGKDFDPKLNHLKNLTTSSQTPMHETLEWMKQLPDPQHFTKKGQSRTELAAIGEGKQISVTAYMLVAKPELGGESCNCGLHMPEETDNHLVLVSEGTIHDLPLSHDAAQNTKTFHKREKESITAEFTPRVRVNHPTFTREAVQPLIADAPENALLVRVTGPLLFDSEHFLANSLVRVNNWEIHPVLKLEYCESGNCTLDSDEGWKSLDDLTAATP